MKKERFSLFIVHNFSCLIALAKSTHNGRRFIFFLLILRCMIALCVNLKILNLYLFTQAFIWGCFCEAVVWVWLTLILYKRNSFKLSHGTWYAFGRLSDNNWHLRKEEQILPINYSINPSNNFSICLSQQLANWTYIPS